MEAWSFRRFRRPYLAVSAIVTREEGTPTIVIHDSQGSFDIEVEDRSSSAELARRIEKLRDPGDDAWRALKSDLPGDPFADLVQQMDHLSLIEDGDVPGKDDEVALLDCAATETSAWIAERLPRDTTEAVGLVSCLQAETERLLADALADYEVELPISLPSARRRADPYGTDNFFLTVLIFQARYLQRAAPLTLLAWYLVLTRVLASADPGARVALPEGWSDWAQPWVGGIYSRRDLHAHLRGLADSLAGGIGPQARRLFQRPQAVSAPLSGVNFMIAAERLARQAGAAFGESRYHHAIMRPEAALSPLVVGRFVEEFHLNRRFVEIIAPALSKRLSARLRERMFRYYEEEVGHEALELETCKSLGVDESALRASLPLPLYDAYIDVFAQISDIDSIGFLASVMVTEGMLGEPLVLNDRLEELAQANPRYREVARKHEQLNTQMNHASLARLFMAEVERVGPVQQKRGLFHMLLTLELGFRVWDQLYDFYAPLTEMAHRGWFSTKDLGD